MQYVCEFCCQSFSRFSDCIAHGAAETGRNYCWTCYKWYADEHNCRAFNFGDDNDLLCLDCDGSFDVEMYHKHACVGRCRYCDAVVNAEAEGWDEHLCPYLYEFMQAGGAAVEEERIMNGRGHSYRFTPPQATNEWKVYLNSIYTDLYRVIVQQHPHEDVKVFVSMSLRFVKMDMSTGEEEVRDITTPSYIPMASKSNICHVLFPFQLHVAKFRSSENSELRMRNTELLSATRQLSDANVRFSCELRKATTKLDCLQRKKSTLMHISLTQPEAKG